MKTHSRRSVDIRDGREHALVDGEQKVRDLGTSDRGRSENILESKVVEVSDKLTSAVAEGKRVTPKEPLLDRISTKINLSS